MLTKIDETTTATKVKTTRVFYYGDYGGSATVYTVPDGKTFSGYLIPNNTTTVYFIFINGKQIVVSYVAGQIKLDLQAGDIIKQYVSPGQWFIIGVEE